METAERFNGNRIVTDLDAIIGKAGFVKLHGKEHEIHAVLVEEFFAFANAIANIENLKSQKGITHSEYVNAHYEIIFPVCPTVTKEDINKCTISQLAAFVNLVNLHVTGGLTDEKKKTMMKRPQN